MKNASLMVWDVSPKNSYKFKLVTKITTLGSPDELKSLLGFYINTNQKSTWTAADPTGHMLKVSYRSDTGDTWKTITDTSNDNGLVGTRFDKHIFVTPIKNIRQVQLKIEAQGYIKGDVSINDFGLIYRKYRDTSASTLDED
tara:strand:- start:1193 stop:1618 length:426 start_codon:yes stop_codon:yes gene_type:complete